ncbi:MAG: efflux RND transporter periplasmic adaptor subunit [Alphaproteobacteria bacterium]|jgi:multidrug efflux system membrane fusion protein|nr:efflux RND transporter periplasmic adaptor subunit [Alphaproteobacteria bacterium]
MNMQVPPPTSNRDVPAHETLPGNNRARRYLLGGLALVLVLGGYYYWSHAGKEPPRRLQATAPVRVAPTVQRDMAVVEHTIGTVVANSTVSVTARVQGQLTKAYFKEGQMVKQGDLLFEIDPRPYQAAYDNAVATLASTKSTAERNQRLAAENAISAQQNETAEAAYLQAKANAEAARLNLEFTKIHSPVDGKTGPILLQPGNLVSVNGLTAPLVTITQIQPIKVSFNLPQSDLPRIQARARQGGLTATVNLHDMGGQDIGAPVDFISNAVSNSAGTIELRATFPNKDGALVPGQLVDVTVELADIPGAIVIPRIAVNIGPDSQYAYVVNSDHVVEQHNLKVLFDDGTHVAIQSDIKPGQMVITDGALRALPGGKVNVAPARPSAAQPAAPAVREAARGKQAAPAAQ